MTRWITIFVLCLSPLTVLADSLDRFFTDLKTYRAAFEQVTRDQYGTVVQDAAGTMMLARPGRFRWDYTTPYVQLVLGDGERLWTYDADLEQATVKPQSDVLAGTPAELLSQSVSPRKLFAVKTLNASGALKRFELTPRESEQGGYQRIVMDFLHNELVSMELVDGFGQHTEIRFLSPERNVELPADAFQFELPAGADLIGEP